MTSIAIHFPHWVLILLSAVLPASLIVGHVRRRRRGAAQLCPSCGYDLRALVRRARDLNCLSHVEVHGAPAGQIALRPGGERSFCAIDPRSNQLCFVDDSTLFTGQ